MSLMWVPKDPRATPIYAYRGRGYSLMNVLDPEIGGEMTARLLPEGETNVGSKGSESYTDICL
ncbi:hypothetical protein HanPI659440_Chr11g0422211 [Helianthus annuus]|nr:hypothetical protein HanPI659440_Chr11g0422211 [Helianthus annuus]